MLLSSTLLSFSPDVEKLKFLTQRNDFEFVVLNETIDDIKDIYFLKSNLDNYLNKLKSSLFVFSETNPSWDVKISHDVLNQSIKILENLYPSFYEILDESNIYPTNYGTIIFDWEKSTDELFSLEIGKDSFGYFIEKKNIDEKQIDSLSLADDEFENSMKKLLTDLSVFI